VGTDKGDDRHVARAAQAVRDRVAASPLLSVLNHPIRHGVYGGMKHMTLLAPAMLVAGLAAPASHAHDRIAVPVSVGIPPVTVDVGGVVVTVGRPAPQPVVVVSRPPPPPVVEERVVYVVDDDDGCHHRGKHWKHKEHGHHGHEYRR